LNEEALDRTMWKARFGRGFGPVVRQTTKWMNDVWILDTSRESCSYTGIDRSPRTVGKSDTTYNDYGIRFTLFITRFKAHVFLLRHTYASVYECKCLSHKAHVETVGWQLSWPLCKLNY
jgi:hypothetical protein